MILRTLALAGGISGAAALSQFPEFSQQYTQRLGGAVDELARQIDRHETDARKLGLTVGRMLDELAEEGPLSRTQAGNIASDIARHARLSADLAALEGAGPFTRARLATHLADPAIAARAWEAYRPAVPASFEGAVFAGTGFLTGWLLMSGLFAFLAGGWEVVAGLFGRRAT